MTYQSQGSRHFEQLYLEKKPQNVDNLHFSCRLVIGLVSLNKGNLWKVAVNYQQIRSNFLDVQFRKHVFVHINFEPRVLKSEENCPGQANETLLNNEFLIAIPEKPKKQNIRQTHHFYVQCCCSSFPKTNSPVPTMTAIQSRLYFLTKTDVIIHCGQYFKKIYFILNICKTTLTIQMCGWRGCTICICVKTM